jgi:hypothetical protein
MTKVPAFAKAFSGRWRIVEMDNWDNDVLDLIEEAHLTFKGAADGEIAFCALKGFLDVRYGARDGSACAEFSWEGQDSLGKDKTRMTPPTVADGPQSALRAASSGTSTFTTATIQASSANATDFFNTLLEHLYPSSESLARFHFLG